MKILKDSFYGSLYELIDEEGGNVRLRNKKYDRTVGIRYKRDFINSAIKAGLLSPVEEAKTKRLTSL